MALGMRAFSAAFVARVGTLVLAVGTQSCLAWFLGTAGRGSYAVCLIYATLLGLVFGLGFDIASIYFVSSKRFTLSEGITYGLISGGVSSALAIVAGLVLMQFPWSFFDKASPTAFYLALATVPVLLLSMVFRGLLTSVQLFGWFAIVSLLHGIAKLVLATVFVWSLSWGVNGAVLADIVAGIVTIVVALTVFCWKYEIALVRPSMAKLLSMLHYGARYYVGKVSNEMNFQIGTIILAFFATREEVGLFAVASKLTMQATAIPDALITVLIPKVSGDKTGQKELIARCARMTALVCGLLLLMMAVFAKPIVTVLFSPAFLPAAALVQILSIGILVRCTCKVFVPYLLGTNHPGMVSISVVAGMVVNLGVLMLLLPLLGLPGAAVGMAVGYFVSSALLTLGFVRISSLSVTQTLQLRRSDWSVMSNALARVGHKLRVTRMPSPQ